MAKYLSVNLTGQVEAFVRSEAERLNISNSAFVSMTLSQAMLSQGMSRQGGASCLQMQQVDSDRNANSPTCGPQRGASYSNVRLEDLGAL